jgi:hypothetical protein
MDHFQSTKHKHMNIVFLYSGQTRTFAKSFKDQNGGELSVWKSQLWQVIRHFPGARCYASVANDQDAQDIYVLRRLFDNHAIEVVDQPTLEEPRGASTYLQAATPFRISSPVQFILRQMWHYQKVWDMYKTEAQAEDVIFRIRPDLFFTRFTMDAAAIRLMRPTDAMFPFWGSYGGVNDRFGAMGLHAAMCYFTAFSRLDEMLKEGAPFHPETLQAYAMERGGCTIRHNLCADFMTVRPNGQFIPPVHLPIDQLLYACT